MGAMMMLVLVVVRLLVDGAAAAAAGAGSAAAAAVCPLRLFSGCGPFRVPSDHLDHDCVIPFAELVQVEPPRADSALSALQHMLLLLLGASGGALRAFASSSLFVVVSGALADGQPRTLFSFPFTAGVRAVRGHIRIAGRR
uniref:Putative secreted protein n=1 Tax=Anopheles darlingi TaxID=43151 RepID=A0A2M4DEQ6_ANODA